MRPCRPPIDLLELCNLFEPIRRGLQANGGARPRLKATPRQQLEGKHETTRNHRRNGLGTAAINELHRGMAPVCLAVSVPNVAIPLRAEWYGVPCRGADAVSRTIEDEHKPHPWRQTPIVSFLGISFA